MYVCHMQVCMYMGHHIGIHMLRPEKVVGVCYSLETESLIEPIDNIMRKILYVFKICLIHSVSYLTGRASSRLGKVYLFCLKKHQSLIYRLPVLTGHLFWKVFSENPQ